VQVTHPSRPGVVLEASQQILIEALPHILVLHMKRFCYDTGVGGVVKVGKQVRFGPELDIGNGGFRFFDCLFAWVFIFMMIVV
jgi:ubiquitin carboxyl-terminal hydrolase 10